MRRFAATLAASTILAMSAPALAQENPATPAFRVEVGGGSNEGSLPPSYAWLQNIGACSTTCGTGTRVTSYQCQNIADFDYSGGGYGAPEDEAYCTHSEGAKPASQTSSCTVYSGCGYDWVNPPVEQTPIPLDANPVGRIGCGYVNQTFSPYCQRTGGGSNVVLGATDHEFCSGDRPDYDNVASGDPDALGYDRNVTQTGSCTTSDHDWQRGAWGPWSSTCSATAVRTRSVSCERRFDGTTQPDARCNQSEDHAATQVQAVYSGCSYSRGTTITNTGPWASGCSSNTTRTLTYNCLRSDGTSVAATECTSRSVGLTQTETGANYASCTYAWTPNDTTTGWGPSSNTCSSSATQTRTVTCQRSNGDTVADSNCTGTRPASSRTIADYSSCTYSRGTTVTNTGPWASGCSSSTTRTLTYNCRRSDGTDVSASECTSRSVGLTQTENGANYASCSYAWTPNDTTTGWGTPSSTCSSSAIQTRSVTCRRSDGATVADSSCTGTRPASTRTVADYSGCSYAWTPNDTTTGWGPSSNTCSSSATQTRSVVCRRSDGTTVADSSCTGTKPAVTRTVADYSSCSYAWTPNDTTSGWGPSSNTCSSSATQTRSVVCRRSDGTTVSDSSCTGTKPAVTRTVADYSSCSYAWTPNDTTTGWGPSSSTCSSTATQSRSVVCRRSDGTTVADSSCSGTKPASTRTVADYSSCSYARGTTVTNTGAWASGCSASTTRTLTYNCRRSDGVDVTASECTSRGVTLTQTETGANYASCTYAWDPNNTTTGWGPSSNTCSASAIQTRSVVCERSDGATVADSNCSGTKPASTRTVADYSGCSYTWSPNNTTSGWGPSSSTCSSSATQTRSVVCLRGDGTTVADSSCTGTKPATSRTVSDYSGCSYAWNPNNTTSGWGPSSSTCSATATQSRSVVCQRSDGATVADSSCSGTKPASTRTIADYSGCSYTWSPNNTTSGWGPSSSTCSASATQTRSVVCLRGDGTTVSDSSCSGTKPATSRTVADYSGCSYAWNPNNTTSGWGPSSSTCSATATQTRSVVCQRSDGTTVSDSSCSGTKPASSRTIADYSGCSYAWNPNNTTSGWGPSSSTCSSSATQTRSVVCRRSDGTTVADSSCSGTKPATSRTVADYSGCSYTWSPNNTTSGWGPSSSTCSASATQTRTVVCQRGDGATVSDSSCSGTKPATSRTVADYSGCSYDWNPNNTTSGWGPSSSTCSATATQTRSVVCRRSDGSTVADSNCSGTKPASSRTIADYSGCSYARGSATGSSWNSTCSTNATQTTTYACRRSDGVNVADSDCTSRGISLTTTSTGANYSSCTYTPTYGAWSTCAPPGTQSRTMTSCRRNGVNQTVANSECTSRGHPSTQTQSCTLTPGTGPILQTMTYGGEGQFCQADTDIDSSRPAFPSWCRNLGGTLLQRRSVYCERTRDPYGEPYEQEYKEYCRAY